MLKRLLFVCLVMMGTLTGFAQEDQSEIWTVLAYGDKVFEPELWRAEGFEDVTRTKVGWQSDTYKALINIDLLHYPRAVTQSSLNTIFDQNWLDATVGSFVPVKQTSACGSNTMRLYEYAGTANASDHTIRYWIEWISPYRIKTIFAAFPTKYMDALDVYSARLYPDFPTCSRVISGDPTPAKAIPLRTEIYDGLTYGTRAFEPYLWQTTVTELSDRTAVSWRADPIGGIASVDHIHFTICCWLFPWDVENFFGEKWFSSVFYNYAWWEEQASCKKDTLYLHEFRLGMEYGDYIERLWVKWLHPFRALTASVLFPADRPELLDHYADALFPELSSCDNSA